MTRILLIDDDEDLRALIELILLSEGYDVAVAADGALGLAIQREHPADLIITDLFMPNQDGIETIVKLRAEFPSTRILAISGGGKASYAHDYLRTAVALGANAVLPKPFEQPAFLRAVREVLAAPAMDAADPVM
jgi:CheY-like chemotaxis protein